jgi:hypothetical protein
MSEYPYGYKIHRKAKLQFQAKIREGIFEGGRCSKTASIALQMTRL